MKPTSIRFYDFTGGLNTKSPPMVLKSNEASDLQNLNILPTGGFEKRNGNSIFNSVAMNSGAAIQGLGYFRTSTSSDYMMVICGNKIYKSDNLDKTMDDISGSVSITSGKDYPWTHAQMNNLSIFVGGAPDAPIKWNGSGNATVLGGTPPNGSFCLTANNRCFIGNTSSNPSTIYWSILGNPEDWSGSGSGSQNVQLNDGDTLVGGSVVGVDTMVLFKQNSTHMLNIRSAPFPLYPLFPNVGAVSKRGIVNVDGVIYFITPEPRMKATDGTEVISFSDSIDDVWDSLNKDRLKFIVGIHNRRLRQIWWFVSTTSSTTHDLCIVWDLQRKCWLRHPTGFKMNSTVFVGDRSIYAGAYDGKIYKLDDVLATEDDSETVPAINAYWRSGWIDFSNTIDAKTPQYATLVYSGSGNLDFTYSYGFDFNKDRVSEYISKTTGGLWGVGSWGVVKWGGDSNIPKLINMKGYGNFFQFFIQHNTTAQNFTFNGVEFGVSRNEVRAVRT